MYNDYFGLQEKPFHITPNPRFIFLSKNHKEAFAHLLYGVQQRVGFLALTGEVGTGKTTVLRTLLRQLEESNHQVALVFNPCLTSLELLQTIHREFGIPCRENEQNLSQLHESLNRFLLAQRQQGRTVVLVIDEAQNLEPSVLEQLRLLSNLETETDKLLQLIIVGQPELDQVLERHELRQLKQRITVRYHLHNMDAEDTAAYIRHRLKVAGHARGEIFTPGALEQIYRLTGGLPRLINILCDRALLVAYTKDRPLVDKAVIQTAQAELAGQEPLKKNRIPVYAFLMVLLLCAGAFWLYQSDRWRPLVEALSPESPPSQAALTPDQNVSPPAPTVTVTEIDENLLQDLKSAIFSQTEKGSGQQAASAVLGLWGKKPLNDFTSDRYHPMEATIRDNGMSTIRFQGAVEKLLEFDSPAILSLVLPNLSGKRYLAVLKYNDGKVLTSPQLTTDGWLPLPYLEQIWFGSAVIPWINFEGLPYLDSPGESAAGVRRAQELISLIGYPELEITGTYDQSTIMAVSDLQKRLGLAPDGRIGAQTLLQLYRLAGLEMPQLQTETIQ